MVLLKSESFSPSFYAPDFSLQSVDGQTYSLSSFNESRVLVVLFMCNHCPYVQAIEDRIIALQREFKNQSVQLVGICSNDSGDYPDDSPANLLKRWRDKDYQFPYLIDETQQAAKDFEAVCTPDLYVFDERRKLAYHGRLDDNWQFAEQVTRRDLAEAIKTLLAGKSPESAQVPSMGCSIKWKKQAK
ncbi:MAG: thioredoxin family protein [Candidatus Omnitrophica bacterium]|nr:thioredoxin family protein [Candidatus Omnitrophota bacterium]